jgi:hypothetical protein
MGIGSLPGVKWPRRGVDHPPSSSAEVKERVELYLYSPLWAFLACSMVDYFLIGEFYLSSVKNKILSRSQAMSCLTGLVTGLSRRRPYLIPGRSLWGFRVKSTGTGFTSRTSVSPCPYNSSKTAYSSLIN